MFCSACGQQIANDAKFCGKCGKKITVREPASVPAQVNSKSSSSPSQNLNQTRTVIDSAKHTTAKLNNSDTVTIVPVAATEPNAAIQNAPASTSVSTSNTIKTNKFYVAIGLIAVLILAVGIIGYKYYFSKQIILGDKTEQSIDARGIPSTSQIQEKNEPTVSNATPHAANTDVVTDQIPTSWTITVDKLFASTGVSLNHDITKLVSALEAPKGEGVPVSKKEFMDMLSSPKAQAIYYKEIMKYATPVSRDIQKKEHEDYAKIFMREVYQKAGLAFLKAQGTYLKRAEKEYGVLQRDIVSILIWESGLGKFTGNYQEFNVFLGQILFLEQAQEIAVKNIIAEGKPNPLDDPTYAAKEKKRLDRRKAQAVENMVALLRFGKKTGQDPFDMKGSWGGAIGSVQFMPANLKYAVDGDGDGKLNLSDWPDAIMSAANFLKIRGKYDSTNAGRKRAFLRYNPSLEYANGVMLLADTIWKRHMDGE
jgi:membrane-bound lytic murein transglycosylase B